MASTYANEPGSQPIAQFTVPTRGTWNSVAIHQVPLDALYNSLNVWVWEGKLRSRPGLSLLDSSTFDSPVIGAAMAVTPTEKRILACTANGLYERGEFDSSWLLRTTIPFGADTVDITFLETSGQYVALLANAGYPLKQWTIAGGVAPVTASTGTVPMAKSICVAGRRVIALVPPHTVQWSQVLNHQAWPTVALTKTAQTGDMGIAVRSFSALSFVVYKERSIYQARSQAGTDATAFSFAEPLMVEGPAGVHAIVDMGGYDIYMTKNGRIGMFDGSRYPQWIADGLWLFLQKDIDPLYSHLIHGVYDFRLHTVLFFYPRRGDNGRIQGMVLINMPLEGTDLQGAVPQQPHSYLGYSSIPCTKGCEKRFDRSIDRTLLFSSRSSDCQSFLFDEDTNTDDSEPFECMMQTGLVPMPDAKHGSSTVELLVERGKGYGEILLDTVTSNGLENKSGTIQDMEMQHIQLEADPIRQYYPFNVRTRFAGLKYTWSSLSTIRYSGSIVYGRPLA